MEKNVQQVKNNMDLTNLIQSNEIDRSLIPFYLNRIRIWYPDYQIIDKDSDPDYFYFRKKVGQSTFGVKPNVFTVDITTDIKVHYTQLAKIS